MSFYAQIKTELTSKKFIMCAIEELKKSGEITGFRVIEKKNKIEIDREGDIINIVQGKAGNFEVAGDNRVITSFTNRLKQLYAYESIKQNLPLDFEIAKETEVGSDIVIVLKG